MKTMEPITTGEQVPGRRYGMIAISVALVLFVIAGGWFLLRNDEKTATDHVQDVAAAMRNDDIDTLAEILGFDDVEATEYRFIDWHIGWDAQPEFTNVVETQMNSANTGFTATVIYGDDSFYSRALYRAEDTPLTTTVRGFVRDDGTVEVSSWPPPHGLTTVEGELRTWIEINRPELYDEMFGSDYSGMRWSRRSGELRIEVLDDFLAGR